MPKPGFTSDDSGQAVVEIPAGAAPDMIRELRSLGLTQETSIGILRVLMRSDVQTAAHDPGEW